MYSIAIAVPGSAGKRDAIWYVTGNRYIQSSDNDLSNEHKQENTLGVVLAASGIAKENQFIVEYPQNLNIGAPAKVFGDLGKATRPERDSFYGRSVSIGVDCLAETVKSVAEKVDYKPVRLLLVGYSQGSQILQAYLSHIGRVGNRKLVDWLDTSLKRSIFLANPVRDMSGVVKDICLSRTETGVKQVKAKYSGSLAYHGNFMQLDLAKQLADRCVNVFWEDDVIAQIHETKYNKYANLKHVTDKSRKVHADYSAAKEVLKSIVKEHCFTGEVAGINTLGVADFVSPLDTNAMYTLAKKYLLTRIGSGDELRTMLQRESHGVPDANLWNRFSLVKDNYSNLGKIVQAAVWARVAQLMSRGLNKTGYFHNISADLVAYGHSNVTSPEYYLYILAVESEKANKITDDNSVGTDLLAHRLWLYRRGGMAPSMNAAMAELLQKSYPAVPLETYPDWLYSWDGNPTTDGVKEFLGDAVMDMQPVGKKRASLEEVLVGRVSTRFRKFW